MTRGPSPKLIARVIIGATAALDIGHLWLGRSTGSLTDQSAISDVIYVGVTLAFSALFAAIGWAIVTRQPREHVGWLLLAVPLLTALAFFVGDDARRRWSFAPEGSRWTSGGMGRPLDDRGDARVVHPDFRVPGWADPVDALAPGLVADVRGSETAIVSFALTPGRLTGAFADLTTVRVINPLGIDGLRGPLQVMTNVGGVLTLLAAVLAGVALAVRYRGAASDVRQQSAGSGRRPGVLFRSWRTSSRR